MMQQNKKRVVVIGAGFAGLSAAGLLARKGYSVVLLEKNDAAGGRARVFRTGGYTFDMGPSWYWMPEVFDRYFAHFKKKPSDYYALKRLDPAFVVHFRDKKMEVPSSLADVYKLFDREEAGAAARLKSFLEEAAVKYNIAFSDFIYKPSNSIVEFADVKFISFLFQLSLFSSFHSLVRKYFSNPFLIQLLEFPVLFLGGSPRNIPGLYSLMNYAAFSLGTWYPMGGFGAVVDGMVGLCLELGVQLKLSEPVNTITVDGGVVTGVTTANGRYACDAVVNTADYVHAESMLDKKFRNYSDNYWKSKVFSPSSLIFFLGVRKKLPCLEHHNLFFDAPFEAHCSDIYDAPRWPDRPLFYVCCPSRTDPSVAPEGHENLFVLMPVAPGLEDSDATRKKYFDQIIERIELKTDTKIRTYIDYMRSYCLNDFESDYHSYKGNAYGLANTLRQTAFLKPAMKSKKVRNLFYAGQLTVPGPGVPPAIISGQIAAEAVTKMFKPSLYESAI